MLAVAGVWSVYELGLMGSSVQKFLSENYKSVQASNKMLNALNEENGAILLLLKGEWESGRKALEKADKEFTGNLELAEKNITGENDKKYLLQIRYEYTQFKKLWIRPIVDTPRQGNLVWYYKHVYSHFSTLQSEIKKLSAVNDKAVFETSRNLKSTSDRAVMPGIISVIAALIFTFVFVFLINHYFIGPIIKMKNKLKDFIEKKTPFIQEIETTDEIKELEDSIRLLCEINQSLDN